jgi:3-hydroxyacyl-CoA dehydrogenase
MNFIKASSGVIGSGQRSARVLGNIRSGSRDLVDAGVLSEGRMRASLPHITVGEDNRDLCDCVFFFEAVAEDAVAMVTLSNFGQRFSSIGLLEYFDSCGIDLRSKVRDYLFKNLCNATAPQQYILARRERGELGMKTGLGLHDRQDRDKDEFRLRKCKLLRKSEDRSPGPGTD